MRIACPPIVTFRSSIKLVGLTELVSTIRSQNGQGSHSWIPRVSKSRRLITLTPDPLSTIVRGSSNPLIVAVISGLLVSTTAGPSFGLEKNGGACNEFGGVIAAFSPSVNRGTNCNSRPNDNVIFHSCSACHVGFSSCIVSVSSVGASFCCVTLATFCSLAFSTHSVACF